MKITAAFLAFIVFLSGCTSTTLIQSNPTGAKVFINEEYYGTTPTTYSDQKIVTSTNHVRLELDGYETFYTVFSRNEEPHVGAIIGGFFLYFPFLWAMQYKPHRTYHLSPLISDPERIHPQNEVDHIQSISDQLRELKALYQDGIITEEEFNRMKGRIIDQQ